MASERERALMEDIVPVWEEMLRLQGVVGAMLAKLLDQAKEIDRLRETEKDPAPPAVKGGA